MLDYPCVYSFIKYLWIGTFDSSSSLDSLNCDRIADLKMELATEFVALARRGLTMLDYTLEFCLLAETLKSLYWIRVNYYLQIDLPDMKGLDWREANVRCLEMSTCGPSARPETHRLRGAATHAQCRWRKLLHRDVGAHSD